jgi:hypothetical protein
MHDSDYVCGYVGWTRIIEVFTPSPASSNIFSVYKSIPNTHKNINNSYFQQNTNTHRQEAKLLSKEIDRVRLRRWRKRGFYSESVLVKLLQKKGYNAVRIPVSNPSLNPLPDIIGRKGNHSYAFEVKNASYYA